MKNRSILIVGKKGILTWQEDLKEAFLRIGCRCAVFHVNPASVSEVIEKKRAKKTPFLSAAFQRRLGQRLASDPPQLMLFLSMAVLPEGFSDFIDSALPRHAVKAAWMADCVEKISGGPHGSFDSVFYFDSYLQPVLLESYRESSKVVYLPLAVNDRRYFFEPRDRLDRMLFAGTCSDGRLSLLNTLKHQVPLDVYGPGCRHIFGRRFGRRLPPKRLNRLFNSYTASLNINQRPNTVKGLNFRPFEASAAGSLVFNEAVPDLAEVFAPGEEIVSYGSVEELVDKWNALVKDPSLREKIARAGRQRTLQQHTFVHRAEFMIRHFGI